jgi:energy-coupling factor transporter transmembrane protein EcfT
MKRSQLLLLTNLVTVLYLAFGFFVFFALGTGSLNGNSGWGVLFFAVLSIFLIPHLILFTIGLSLGWVAYFRNSPGIALASAIFYTVGSLTLIHYFYLGLTSAVMGYVAYAFLLKAKKQAQLGGVDASV